MELVLSRYLEETKCKFCVATAVCRLFVEKPSLVAHNKAQHEDCSRCPSLWLLSFIIFTSLTCALERGGGELGTRMEEEMEGAVVGGTGREEG